MTQYRVMKNYHNKYYVQSRYRTYRDKWSDWSRARYDDFWFKWTAIRWVNRKVRKKKLADAERAHADTVVYGPYPP